MFGVITPGLVRAALVYVSPNMPRDDWAKIGMAIKSCEFSDDEGLAIFDEWSAAGENYSPQAVRATWRSLKAGGGVTIGTLFHEAKAKGFKLESGAGGDAPPDGRNSTTSSAHAERRREADQQQRAQHEQAASEAAEQWANASPEGASPYLLRKGVDSHGVRFTPDGWLLVPLRDEGGKLWNVQRIAPKATPGKPDKLFLKGGRKSGLWHWCGSPADASVLAICEGYATGASVHEATSLPVAVAFDAGNLPHVARAVRKLYPNATIVLCADDDRPTMAKTGRNPGKEKAAAAARAARGIVALPGELPAGAKDFNDLHQAAGAAVVRERIDAALAEEPEEEAQRGRRSSMEREHVDQFAVDDIGVWHHGMDQEGKRRSPDWVCSRLDVLALTRDQDNNGWGYLLAFFDPRGDLKQWAMPARMLSGDGSEYRAALLNMGLRIATSPKARNLLTQYIQSREPGEHAQCTDRIGWHGTAFVFPRETVGDKAERIVFQTDSAVENTFRVRGTAEQWRDGVGRLCAGNSRLVFAVSCAFAGPLLRPAGMESGGFHFRGDSSSGKTTALKVAASVYGGASYLQRWRTTDNALEAIAAQHSDVLLILDELAQVDPKTAGECAYMLANEQSKARSTRTGLPRARLTWRLLFLSAGELGLADHMAEGMKRTRTGQEVRMADIPVDAGAGMGAFQQLHGLDGGAALARSLTRGALANYGATGRAFIEWACQHADVLAKRVRGLLGASVGSMVPESASGQVQRVGARFALVGVAGELATEAGLTGWAAGEATAGARSCFNAWLESRGGLGNGEIAAMLRQVRRFLEGHGEGRFTWWHRGADDHSAKTLQRAGYRRMLDHDGRPIRTNGEHGAEFGDRMPSGRGEEVSVEYFILPEVFRSEVCVGFDARAVAAVLRDHECLTTDKGALTFKTRLPGMGHVHCYRISPAIFGLNV